MVIDLLFWNPFKAGRFLNPLVYFIAFEFLCVEQVDWSDFHHLALLQVNFPFVIQARGSGGEFLLPASPCVCGYGGARV